MFQRLSPLLKGESTGRGDNTQGVALFCPTSNPEFITSHVSQYGGALISVQFFQEANVLFTDRVVSEGSPDCFMLKRNTCLLEVYRCNPHVLPPLSAFLGYESVRHKVVRCSEYFF